jgi:hypothetical protein
MERIVPVFAMVASVTYARKILAVRHEGCTIASKVARAQGLQPSNDRAIFEYGGLSDCGLIKSGSGSDAAGDPWSAVALYPGDPDGKTDVMGRGPNAIKLTYSGI